MPGDLEGRRPLDAEQRVEMAGARQAVLDRIGKQQAQRHRDRDARGQRRPQARNRACRRRCSSVFPACAASREARARRDGPLPTAVRRQPLRFAQRRMGAASATSTALPSSQSIHSATAHD